MAMGLGYLRLPPDQFWSMTAKELEAAITGLSGGDVARPLMRSGLEELLLQFPDEVRNG